MRHRGAREDDMLQMSPERRLDLVQVPIGQAYDLSPAAVRAASSGS